MANICIWKESAEKRRKKGEEFQRAGATRITYVNCLSCQGQDNSCEYRVFVNEKNQFKEII